MPDGYMDLKLKFATPALARAIAPMESGQERSVALTGSFGNGDPLVGTDGVNAVGGGRMDRPFGNETRLLKRRVRER